MKTLTTLILTLTILSYSTKATAQDFRKSSIDLNAGIAVPYMDVQGDRGFVGSVSYHYAFAHPISTHITVLGGTLSGNDKNLPYNRKFANNFTAIMVGAEVNLFALTSLSNPSRIVDPYISAEVGPLFSNIVSINDQDGLGATEYKGVDLAIGLGGGLKFYLSPLIDLNSKFTFFIPNSDNIDGYNAPIDGNKAKDFFAAFQIGVNIKMGSTDKTHAMWASRAEDDKQERLAELKKRDREKAKNVFSEREAEENGKVDNVSNKTQQTNDTSMAAKELDNRHKPKEEETGQITNRPEQAKVEEEKEKPTPQEVFEEPGSVEFEERAVNEEENVPPPPETQPEDEVNVPVPASEEEPVVNNKDSAPIYKTKVLLPSGETGNYKYYVIIGSFRSKQNAAGFISANDYVGNLQIITDNSGTYYRVAAGQSNDLPKAQILREELRQDFDSASWILENAAH